MTVQCRCGNTPEKDGFGPVEESESMQKLCLRCGRILNANGGMIGVQEELLNTPFLTYDELFAVLEFRKVMKVIAKHRTKK